MDQQYSLQVTKLMWLDVHEKWYIYYVGYHEWIADLNADDWETFKQLIELSENEQ